MPIPIYSALMAQANLKRSKLHMPGHKGISCGCLPPELVSMLPLDSTELPGTGDLFAEKGSIFDAENLSARLFGAARTLFSAGGSTLCIQAMLRAAFPQGGKLICGSVLHRSAADAFCLLDIKPVFMRHDDSSGKYFAGRITPTEFSNVLRDNPDARAVYLTCPDYFGVLHELPAIADIAHSAGILVLVDAAHGAHLDFLSPKLGAVSAGADFTAQSAHKTLPAMTGAAFLHLSEEKYAQAARNAMRVFASSSPSFPILLSLDCAREWLATGGREELSLLSERVAEVKKTINRLGFPQARAEVDPLRIAFAVPDDCDAGLFLRTHGIEPEYAERGRVILIPGVANNDEDFLHLLAVLELLAESINAEPPSPFFIKSCERVLSPREAFMARSKYLPLNKALGKIAARNIIPCPPAVPIALAGEKIDANAIEQLRLCGEKGAWAVA